MTAEAEQTDRTDNEQTPQNESANPAEAESTNTAQAEGAPGESSAERERAGTENSGNGRPPARRRARRSQQPTYVFSPQGAAQAGLLHLATVWKESGALYQAIPAYLEILERYPRTGVAAAATEGLVDLAHRLEEQGRFYTALSIFRKMETML